ncbi:MAG: polysaccharide pyruvyl transferase family protein, partial [Clostridia bacterium]|nr:polysaccharide pyruvyl transferase family protein [Clostridia bacterium]
AVALYGRRFIEKHYGADAMARTCEAEYLSLIAEKGKKAVLCGYYGAGNVGDALLLSALSHRLKEEGYRRVLPLSLRHPSLLAVYAAYRRYDFFLGGGNLLQDATSRRSLSFYLFFLSFAQRRGCATALISAGLGPLSAEGKRRVAPVLAKLSVAECRTHADRREALALGASPVIYRADAVLSLPLPTKKEGERVMLAFRPSPFAHYAIQRAAERYGRACFFFAMHPADRAFGKRCAKTFSIPYCTGSAEDFLQALRECRLLLGDRLHAGICALGMEIPFFLDGKDEKCARFLADVKKAAENGGFCGDIRTELPLKTPDSQGMRATKEKMLS